MGKSLPLEKQCASGVIYCQLLEAARPGSIAMVKVDSKADAEHKALPNYRLLEAALHKAGVMGPQLDAQSLARGNPVACLQLLQQIYYLAPPQSPVSHKGLSALDPNSLDPNSRSSRQSSKRKLVSGDAAPRAKRKIEDGGSAAPAAPSAAAEEAPPANALELALRSQLELARAELSTAKAEAANLKEEAEFYEQKLTLIEQACHARPAAELAGAVMQLLQADETEVGGMVPVA